MVQEEWSVILGVTSRPSCLVSLLRASDALLETDSVFCLLTVFSRSKVFFRTPLGPDLTLCLRRVQSMDDFKQAAHGA